MMEITKHNVPIEEMNILMTKCNGNLDSCRLWVNQRSLKEVYVSADINMGIIKLNVFSVEFSSQEIAEGWLNEFDFDVDYDICGDEEE